jgi:hypothetical protein
MILKKKFTIVDTPQQNWVLELKNRTLVGGFFDNVTIITKAFWGKALLTTNYLKKKNPLLPNL